MTTVLGPGLTEHNTERGRVRSLEIRKQRAILKRQLKTGDLTLADALHEEALQSMLLWDLLLALPDFALCRAQKLWNELEIRSPLFRVEQLTLRKRGILVATYARIER